MCPTVDSVRKWVKLLFETDVLPMTEAGKSPKTKERLLNGACAVFAEKGFKNARVRDICRRAEANVAAVNYYFGDKKGLYEAVLRHAFFTVTGPDPTDWGIGEDAEPEERLHALIKTLLGQLLSEGRSALFVRLVGREMVDPTSAVERVIDEGIRPQVNILFKTLREMLPDRVSEQQVRRCAASIFGQCLFYFFARPAVLHLRFERKLGPSSVNALAKHITEFSLAALRSMGVKKDRSAR